MKKLPKKKESAPLSQRVCAVYLAAMLGFYLLYPGLGGYMTITVQLAGRNPLALYPEGMTYFDAYKR